MNAICPASFKPDPGVSGESFLAREKKKKTMVMKRIRSEYMKKFRDPKWETYSRCYEEMLRYRLTRRLLEATHNPWYWSGSDSDSESGGKRSPPVTPPPFRKTWGRCEASGARTEVELDQSRSVPRLPLPEEVPQPAVHGGSDRHTEACLTTYVLGDSGKAVERRGSHPSVGCREELGNRAEQRTSSRGSKHFTVPHTEPDLGSLGSVQSPHPQQNKPPLLSRPTWRSPRVQPQEDDKDRRHPFALYGSGEKDADIASRKTHNVAPAASTNEIHESALRAKTRREVKHQVQVQIHTQRTKQRRAKITSLDESRKLVQTQFNPWITEYMHCFSARA